MADQTINNKGELLTTTTDVSNLEYELVQIRDLLAALLKSNQRIELYLSIQTDVDLGEQEDLWD